MRLAPLLVCLAACLAVACGKAPDRAATGGAPRIVSLTPSATEIVAALGATPQLVGVDAYSKYPPEVEQLPKVGSFLQPNVEAIVRLQPTFVIVDDVHGQTAGALHDAKIATVECPMHALPDVKACLRTLGDKLGRRREADAEVAAIDQALDDAAAHKPARHPKVLAIIDREQNGIGHLVAAGPGSWLDELLAVSGGDNVLAASGGRYPTITLEDVLRAQPEVILDLSDAAHKGLAPWQELDVPAVKQGRVRALFDAPLQGPSPRVKDALGALAGALR